VLRRWTAAYPKEDRWASALASSGLSFLLQCGLCSGPIPLKLTYEILGIRPLLIDKLSNYCIPKDGVLLPRMDSYSSVLPVIVDPFIIK
jgi:hypothetical protein